MLATKRAMNLIVVFAVAGFLIGIIPLLAFAFFSPGLQSEAPWGYLTLAFGAITFLLLIVAARARRLIWILVVFQALLLAAVLFETLSDSRLYIGT
jgi:hypothetical protein